LSIGNAKRNPRETFHKFGDFISSCFPWKHFMMMER